MEVGLELPLARHPWMTSRTSIGVILGPLRIVRAGAESAQTAQRDGSMGIEGLPIQPKGVRSCRWPRFFCESCPGPDPLVRHRRNFA